MVSSRRTNPIVELGVTMGHAAQSEAPDLKSIDKAITMALREIPLHRRIRVSLYLLRGVTRQLLRDFITEHE